MSTSFQPPTLVKLDSAVYRLNAIKKAAYKFAGRCMINISTSEGREVTLAVDCHDPQIDVPTLLREIHAEITDQELREVVLEETAAVRQLLLAQAFSATSLIEPEAETADYRVDPTRIHLADDQAGRR